MRHLTPKWWIWETDMARSTLSQHEAICEQRYAEINRRLDNLEKKVDTISTTISEFQTFLNKLAIRSFLGLFVLVCGAVFVIKM